MLMRLSIRPPSLPSVPCNPAGVGGGRAAVNHCRPVYAVFNDAGIIPSDKAANPCDVD